MNINFNNIGIGTGTLGAGPKVEGPKVEGPKVEGQKAESQNLRLSGAQTLDVIKGSEPVADVPESALLRDDDLGRLVASAFNLPPPPMPAFGG